MELNIQDALKKNEVGVTSFALDLHVDVYPRLGALEKMEHIMSAAILSIIRRRVAVASAMFTRRGGAGIAEAWRAGANEARIEARRPEQKLGSRARAGSAEARRLGYFIAPAQSRKHRCPRCAAVDPDMAAFSSIRSVCA